MSEQGIKTQRVRWRCRECGTKTDHLRRQGPVRGTGTDAHADVTYECQACGQIEQSEVYPNLLADVFNIPAKPRRQS